MKKILSLQELDGAEDVVFCGKSGRSVKCTNFSSLSFFGC